MSQGRWRVCRVFTRLGTCQVIQSLFYPPCCLPQAAHRTNRVAESLSFIILNLITSFDKVFRGNGFTEEVYCFGSERGGSRGATFILFYLFYLLYYIYFTL
jgi:hypothetical protein